MVLGALFGIMSGLPANETRIIALALLMCWTSYNILDLSGGLVNILLPIWHVFHMSLLPGTSLLHRLSVLLWVKLVLVVIVSRPIYLI